MRKLTIVVNCTERKAVIPTPVVSVRTLPTGTIGSRFVEWEARVAGAASAMRLADLYRGDAWFQAKSLAVDAVEAGFDTQFLVASAGLGLRDTDTAGPAYAATFAAGHADTVAAGTEGIRQWWSQLGQLPSALRLSTDTHESVMLVLSESYARAMDDDLMQLARRGGDLLLVGGSRDIDGLPRIPADRALRNALGGATSSLNLRMARRWLATRSSDRLHSDGDEDNWLKWAANTRKVENYGRLPGTDDEIARQIEKLIGNDPTLSATKALRQFRDLGFACEQKRFGGLFREIRKASLS
ncbi:MAG: hypothetical protein OJJ55_04380 [Rhodococcus sp.]|nr:hypothetical protein [Rhodococcus sp. (in: high G+C Gram-positive bacteria)]